MNKQAFNRVERVLQQIPSWLFATSAVIALACVALWLEADTIHSPRDAVKVLFEHAESIAIVAAVIFFFKEAPNRKAQKHYEAWQVIDHAAAAKVATSYARIQALQDLNQDGVSLRGIHLPGAHLSEINLRGAILTCADLSHADLVKANLADADLSHANLRYANLIDADLQGANLMDADLSYAILGLANLSSVNLMDADLVGANLMDADLSHADLKGATLTQADLSCTDLRKTKNLTRTQIKSALFWEKAIYKPSFWHDVSLDSEPDINRIEYD
jgi:BTB/POZ domain-containing protein KCTD9